jgi:hypothetical protein
MTPTQDTMTQRPALDRMETLLRRGDVLEESHRRALEVLRRLDQMDRLLEEFRQAREELRSLLKT